MQLGIIGLGKMGAGIARRLLHRSHDVVVFDRNAEAIQATAALGATASRGIEDLVQRLEPPRSIWVMVPAGEPTETLVATLADQLEPGDTIIDGGNTFFKDDIRRARQLQDQGIHYADVGTSGGVWGYERGYCMMVGADKTVFEHLTPLFEALAPGYGEIARTRGRDQPDDRAARGYIHAGPVGAGHFVKMVHNGIEYGLMQAYAEGFDIMKNRASEKLPADERFELNIPDIAEVWRRGSVVSSWLLDLTAQVLAEDSTLNDFDGPVSDSGEGRWTIDAAVEQGVQAPVLAAALFSRFRSQDKDTYADKLLSAMRFSFGGHTEKPQ